MIHNFSLVRLKVRCSLPALVMLFFFFYDLTAFLAVYTPAPRILRFVVLPVLYCCWICQPSEVSNCSNTLQIFSTAGGQC